MDYARMAESDDADIRVSWDDDHSACRSCGIDCAPEPTGADGLAMRVVFVCPEQGMQSIIDPFEDQR